MNQKQWLVKLNHSIAFAFDSLNKAASFAAVINSAQMVAYTSYEAPYKPVENEVEIKKAEVLYCEGPEEEKPSEEEANEVF